MVQCPPHTVKFLDCKIIIIIHTTAKLFLVNWITVTCEVHNFHWVWSHHDHFQTDIKPHIRLCYDYFCIVSIYGHRMYGFKIRARRDKCSLGEVLMIKIIFPISRYSYIVFHHDYKWVYKYYYLHRRWDRVVPSY